MKKKGPNGFLLIFGIIGSLVFLYYVGEIAIRINDNHNINKRIKQKMKQFS